MWWVLSSYKNFSTATYTHQPFENMHSFDVFLSLKKTIIVNICPNVNLYNSFYISYFDYTPFSLSYESMDTPKTLYALTRLGHIKIGAVYTFSCLYCVTSCPYLCNISLPIVRFALKIVLVNSEKNQWVQRRILQVV